GFGELRLDARTLVQKTAERALVGRKRLDRVRELALKLVAALRQVLLLREHSCERRTGRLLRVAARLDLDRHLLSELTMLFGARARLGQNGLMLRPFPVELLATAAELLEHARGLRAAGAAFRELLIECLPLGRELVDGLIEHASSAAQLLE